MDLNIISERSLYQKNKKRKYKDKIVASIIHLAVILTIGTLGLILGYIFIQGLPKVNWHFLTSNFDDQSRIITVDASKESKEYNSFGIKLEEVKRENKKYYRITEVAKDSPLKKATVKTIEQNAEGKSVYVTEQFVVKKGMILAAITSQDLSQLKEAEVEELINQTDGEKTIVKVIEIGEGIWPMMITTLMAIGLSLIISAPIGIFGAIYLNEYAKPGKIVRLIRFGTEALAGIPSIIYGLFGMLFFVTTLKMGLSILAGSFTLSIILLPVMIRQTEESLKTVPLSYREASLGLGATKLQTIMKVILPSALPGIVVGIILSIGRVVGESAALLLTAGTTARIPKSLFQSGATLTIKAYTVAKEQGDYQLACGIGSIIIIIVLIINFSAKRIAKRVGVKEN